MDDIFDFIIDFFLELFVWEHVNGYLRKKITNRPLRWLVTSAIYFLAFTVLLLILIGVYQLLTYFI